MLTRVKTFLKDHTLISIYTLVLLLLFYGVHFISGWKHFDKLGLFTLALYVSYVILALTPAKRWLEDRFDRLTAYFQKFNTDLLFKGLLIYTVATVVFHFIYMGGSPPIQALSLESADEVAMLRRGITEDAPSILNYISAFNIRAFLPFLIFFLFLKGDKRLYYAILILGCFYAFSLMQKSYVITLLTPVLIYAVLKKQWLQTGLMAGLIVIVIIGLSYNANPEFSQTTVDENIELPEDVEDSASRIHSNDDSHIVRIFKGLYHRIMIIPGEMVSKWFDIIPEKKPFLNGEGYRIIAKMKGVEHRNYSAELYPLIRPLNAARGLRGNVNTASFMYDYANFGKIGLILSGISLAFLFILIESMFGNEFSMKFSINLFFVLIISSTALTTTLFSGGWAFIVGLYLFFLKGTKTNEKN